MMENSKSNYKSFKGALNILLVVLLVIILIQNLRSVGMQILFWKINMPLIFLLLLTAIISSAAAVLYVRNFGKNKN